MLSMEDAATRPSLSESAGWASCSMRLCTLCPASCRTRRAASPEKLHPVRPERKASAREPVVEGPPQDLSWQPSYENGDPSTPLRYARGQRAASLRPACFSHLSQHDARDPA